MINNYRLSKFSLPTIWILSMFFTFNAFAQEFPITIESNGTLVKIESMDVGVSGDLFITGRIGNYNQFIFGCDFFDGEAIIDDGITPVLDQIFVAKIHPTSNPVTNEVVWMVIGRSTLITDETFSGKDIEVDADENVYYAGTLAGYVYFQKVWDSGPFTGTEHWTCTDNSDYRHFVSKINSDGEVQWISDAKTYWGSSFGEAITLDEENNRLFTGGYVTPNGPSIINFRDSDCTPHCSFTVSPTPTGSQGFITEYKMDNGVNLHAGPIGERVMALAMDESSTNHHVWYTGSNYASDLDAMLGYAIMPLSNPDCAPFANVNLPVWGVGNDIGLDIAYTLDYKVVSTGAFTSAMNWLGGSMTTVAGNSDVYVSIYDPMANVFIGVQSTSVIPGGVPTTNSSPYDSRSSCIASDLVNPWSNRFIIGYDCGNSRIETQILNTSFTPGGLDYIYNDDITAIGRAMEVEFDTAGNFGERYMAGDLTSWSSYTFGGSLDCDVNPGMLGYISKMDNSNEIIPLLGETNTFNDKKVYVELYPNPASNSFTIQLGPDFDKDDIYNVSVYNSIGQIVDSYKIAEVNSTHNITNYENGIYHIVISSILINKSFKLVKE